MKRLYILLIFVLLPSFLSSCSYFNRSNLLDPDDEQGREVDDQFELESLNSDEHQGFNEAEYNYQKSIKFVDYTIDECKCRILVPDNHTIKKITHSDGSVSYVGLVDMGMYALTFKKVDTDSANNGLDSFFKNEIQKLQNVDDKTVLYSDFILNGFNIKEVTTLASLDFNKTYSVQRVTFDDNLLYKIEFFGVVNSDITYLSANKFLNSLQKQYPVEI